MIHWGNTGTPCGGLPSVIDQWSSAKQVTARICGIVGRDGGFTAKNADVCVIVPPIAADTVTAHAESFQAVVWHLLVSHPSLQVAPMKWESLER